MAIRKKLNTVLAGVSGEYFVAAELSKREGTLLRLH